MILGINFYEHPSRQRTYVFEYTQKERADYFEDLLQREGIKFERETHDKDGKETFFFGVNKEDLKVARNANYLAYAKYRKPFIADPALRYFTLGLSVVIGTLIILGIILN